MRRLDDRRAREIVFLVVGVSTPIGILAVNASAFIWAHLAQFRLGIAVCALVSGFSLNGLGAWAALNRARHYAPNLYAEYRVWLTAAAVLFVVAWSVLGAYGTYQSMKDPRQLPNIYAVLTAVWLLLLPVAITLVSRRLNLGKVDAAPPPREEAVNP
jgi:hypothetical protein